MKDFKHHFFISHAFEDKEIFARPLVEALRQKGYEIWFDELNIKWGDSIVKEISEGIKNSLYGIVILSKPFFKKHWTNEELKALLNKEAIIQNNLILPIWLNLTKEDVYEFSPLLVDKKALVVNEKQINKIVDEIINRTSISITSIKDIQDKIKYLKECSDDGRKKYLLDLDQRIKSIFYYQEAYYNWYTSSEILKNEWDELSIELKGKELQKEYKIPEGVWLIPEPFSWEEINRAVKLCSKWVYRKLTFTESTELFFLLEEVLDTDIHYILYGFPHSTIVDKLTYEKSLEGIKEVGLTNKKANDLKEESFSNLFKKYFR